MTKLYCWVTTYRGCHIIRSRLGKTILPKETWKFFASVFWFSYQDSATTYRLAPSPSLSSSLPSNLLLTPTHTTQMYCQTIGSIQPGKCLSYTSLQAAAIPISLSSQTRTPVIVPAIHTESSTGQMGVLRESYPDMNQHGSGISSSCKLFEFRI